MTRLRSRGLRALALAGALVLALPAAAVTLPRPVLATAGALQMAGSGEMRWFGLKLYDAALWVQPGVDAISPAGAGQPLNKPYALALRYTRNISGEALVTASLDEIRRLGEADEGRLARWKPLLEKALPSVAPGDTLVGLHEPGRGASFWHQGQLTARIDDPQLAGAFFGIWLDARTREPQLRARLLGLARP
ncbi:MAG: chalcone isomerase family protein [Zoogloea sp.]|uniref:chalcone isomerase family protein n=1 Tax=Zoogloea sp. TaxID=49181 RepID=UPI00261988F4|nr:chalcone isomerase family protein [Zoogloea sp.]MDD3325631.1 chalcone isomerase family protein [Zoogloea sp.]